MKKIIILICVMFCCFSNSYLHAKESLPWRSGQDLKDIYPDLEGEEIIEKISREFLIPHKKSKIGFQICAMDNISSVDLRYSKNKVDFKINFFEALFENRGTVYLDILDEDKFLIESFPVAQVCANFSGTINGELNISWEKFSNIKFYEISKRG